MGNSDHNPVWRRDSYSRHDVSALTCYMGLAEACGKSNGIKSLYTGYELKFWV